MKANQISDPVKTQFGYHIIKVIEVKPAKKFEDLDESESVNVKRAMFNEEIKQLKSKAKIKVHNELLTTDKTPDAGGGEMNGMKPKADH
jgi:foldase protein PrsA